MANIESKDSRVEIVRQPAKAIRKTGTQPTALEFNESLLELAGVNKTERVRILRRTLDAQEDALNATTSKTASEKGVITDVKEFVDHQTRLKAAGELQSILGLEKGQTKENNNAAPTINVLIAPFAKPQDSDKEK